MIELKKNASETFFDIYINGDLCKGAHYENKEYEGLTNEASKKIADLNLSVLEPFNYIRLNNLFDWTLFDNVVGISKSRNKKTQERSNLYVEIIFFPRLKEWNKYFTYSYYCEIFEEVWKDTNRFDEELRFVEELRFDEEDESMFWISFEDSFVTLSIREFISLYENKLRETHEVTLRLIASSNKNLTMQFNFPEELKTSCEQYLLYFAQFLRDLGINTTSNIKEEAGKVLFSVTPTDDIEALDKIREALAVYLSLPSSPVLYNDSFQSMQLKQQVENLQHSQRMKEMEMRSAQYALRLAQQNIENQDKIITRQNSFIDNQNKIIEKITSNSIMIDSLENKEELEKFCEGFEVGKSEFLIKHFGLHLNPATVLKNVGKKILGKEETISILDSDEETDKK